MIEWSIILKRVCGSASQIKRMRTFARSQEREKSPRLILFFIDTYNTFAILEKWPILNRILMFYAWRFQAIVFLLPMLLKTSGTWTSNFFFFVFFSQFSSFHFIHAPVPADRSVTIKTAAKPIHSKAASNPTTNCMGS